MKAQKTPRNRALKAAIGGTGKTSRFIAGRAHIPEVRLSKIVTGREVATDDEQKALLRELKKYGFEGELHDLFPASPTSAVA